MQLTHIPIEKLTLSKLNVRKHGSKSIDDLAASIRATGLLQPLLVRASGKSYEVIAGSRRLKALSVIAGDASEKIEPVPCVMLDATDDAAAIEASLAENIARLPMDELDQYTAFAALIREGRSEDDIAAHFGVTQATVKRRLALARLIPDIHRLYRSGEIDAETLKLLTLATRERQKAYVALLRDPDQNAPPRWQLRRWLLGGNEIATTVALFDEALYQGDITGDLFGDKRYFTDAQAFWQLQNAAITTLRDSLIAKGWQAVHVIGPEERYQPHQWESASKSDGGEVVIAVATDGSVETFKGVISREDAKRRAKARNKAATAGHDPVRSGESREPEAVDTDTPVRAELTEPLANYLDLVRLSAVRAALLGSPKIAMRVLVAHLVSHTTHIQVTPEPMTARSEATYASIANLASEKMMAAAQEKIGKLLDLGDERLMPASYAPERAGIILGKLLEFDDRQVLDIAALVMAQTLALGSTMVDTLGVLLKVDIKRGWQPDDAFFDLVRDKAVLHAMLEDVIGSTAAASYLTDTGTAKKATIRNALAGQSRPKVSGWGPRWLTFPQGRYTDRPLTARKPAAA